MKTEPHEPINPVDNSKWFQPGATDKHSQDVVGLTKREWFAGLALQGLCSDSNVTNPIQCAVKMADALIAELNNELL